MGFWTSWFSKRFKKQLLEVRFPSSIITQIIVKFYTLGEWFVTKGRNTEQGFYPVWIRIWDFRLRNSVNDLEHKEHMKGFSPVWIRIWDFRLRNSVNDLEHTEHMKGFSPVWIRIWDFRLRK